MPIAVRMPNGWSVITQARSQDVVLRGAPAVIGGAPNFAMWIRGEGPVPYCINGVRGLSHCFLFITCICYCCQLSLLLIRALADDRNSIERIHLKFAVWFENWFSCFIQADTVITTIKVLPFLYFNVSSIILHLPTCIDQCSLLVTATQKYNKLSLYSVQLSCLFSTQMTCFICEKVIIQKCHFWHFCMAQKGLLAERCRAVPLRLRLVPLLAGDHRTKKLQWGWRPLVQAL